MRVRGHQVVVVGAALSPGAGLVNLLGAGLEAQAARRRTTIKKTMRCIEFI
jgi:hypothetical protein